MKELENEIGYIPYNGMIILNLPDSIYPGESIDVGNKEAWCKIVEERAKEVVNGELKVAAIGEGVTFVGVGDTIIVASHVRLQTLYRTFEGDKFPKMFWAIRECDILVKVV